MNRTVTSRRSGDCDPAFGLTTSNRNRPERTLIWITLCAAWDDLRLGLKHPLSFSKCALVTDVEWLRRGSKVMGPLMPVELMVFHLSDEDAATAWIKT
ncbi:STAS/SEC14 domain-containing protein [Roseovarius arcticus]|uniref:STAS/SEC14 domain-containing protein n=1 Tax=Roseovarius arcticus TaxID=2547404 RepID=UPI001487336C